jgi:formyl-CoA transferase
VLEISTMVAGPMAGQMLADLGAEVIKIETMGGDPLRRLNPSHKGMGALFMAMNRHKRSIQLDLKSPKGQAIARSLALSCDVLIENARPGVMARLGLSYETLREDHPGLVYASVSGFGPSGPYVKRPAFDQVLQGVTGIMQLQNPLGEPQPLKNMFVDKYSAAATASAITAALLFRERHGGQGQFVSVSLLDAFSSFALIDNLHNFMFKDSDARIPYINTTRPIRTADGHMIGHIQTDEQFARICRLLGREELVTDPRFIGAWQRLSHIEDMWVELEKASCLVPTDVLIEGIEREGVPLGRVNTVAEFLDDPQTRHNESVVEYRDDEFGPVLFLNYPARFEKSPADVRARAPKLGEHTDAILAAIGMTPADVAQARIEGYVG